MKPKTIKIITLSSIIVINLSTLAGGVKHHENWQIVIGGIGTALIITAIVVKFFRKRKLVS